MLIQGDAFDLPFADGSYHCVMTSPPYWGLRKYSGEQGQEPLGLEPTPERHIERTVEWAREVRRVLRDDGVFWLNYGDCYAGSWGDYGARDGNQRSSSVDRFDRLGRDNNTGRPPTSMVPLAGGNLMLMPHRIALALQADGWIVRQDLVWAKPNPMPESSSGWDYSFLTVSEQEKRNEDRKEKNKPEKPIQTGIHPSVPQWLSEGLYQEAAENHGEDGWLTLAKSSWRHTRAHEYVFMLVKSMGYFANQEAVREAAEYGRREQPADTWDRIRINARHVSGTTRGANPSAGRNPRSVVNVPTAPYSGAHYATFPPNLIAPLIRATCPRWACPVCGQGWSPVVEKAFVGTWHDHSQNITHGARQDSGGPKADFERGTVTGHRPTCDHPHTQAEAVPGVVFDPFVGSGTTVMVAQQLLRRGIGMDISRPYLIKQATIRTGFGDPPGQLDNLPLFGDADTG